MQGLKNIASAAAHAPQMESKQDVDISIDLGDVVADRRSVVNKD